MGKKEVQWVKRMRENRKKFRKYRQQLRAVQRAIQDEIDELEALVVIDSTEKKARLKQGFCMRRWNIKIHTFVGNRISSDKLIC